MWIASWIESIARSAARMPWAIRSSAASDVYKRQVEDGKVAGLISIGDVVKWRVQEYEREQEALREYIKTCLLYTSPSPRDS